MSSAVFTDKWAFRRKNTWDVFQADSFLLIPKSEKNYLGVLGGELSPVL